MSFDLLGDDLHEYPREEQQTKMRYAIFKASFLVCGKATVLVWPGETVCVVIDFTHPFLGNQVYMIHCHNLEHEDQGMMLNLKIEA